MKKRTYEWNDVHKASIKIALQMYNDDWRPDYIVGISRGGLPLAVVLSNTLKIPMFPLSVNFRDENHMGPESNLWMAEEAFGYVNEEEREIYKSRWDLSKRKNILIVDDINDTGKTFNWIKQDWRSGCFPNEDAAWNSVWHNNVRFATMTENLSSDFDDVRYYYDEVNKAEEDVWLIYPWET